MTVVNGPLETNPNAACGKGPCGDPPADPIREDGNAMLTIEEFIVPIVALAVTSTSASVDSSASTIGVG